VIVETTPNPLRDTAHEYLDRGWSVIPVDGRKRPVDATGRPLRWRQYQRRRPTETEIDNWFGNGTKAVGLAVVLGPISGLAVIDIDNHVDGPNGHEHLDQLGELPPGPMAATPSNGRHHFFRYAPRAPRKGLLAPGIEYLATGCIVAVPPGDGRRWIVGPDVDVPDVPDHVVARLGQEHLQPRRRRGRPLADVAFGAEVGERNDTLASYVGHLIQRGRPLADVRQLAAEWSRRCPEPLPPAEVEGTVRSIWRRHGRRDGDGPRRTSDVPHVRLAIAFMDSPTFLSLRPSDRSVLAALVRHASADGLAWPSIATLAAEANVGRRTVPNSTARLEAAGIVEVVRPRFRRYGNTYRLNLALITGAEIDLDQEPICATSAHQLYPVSGGSRLGAAADNTSEASERIDADSDDPAETEGVAVDLEAEAAAPEITPDLQERVDQMDPERRRGFKALHDRGVLAGVAVEIVVAVEPARIAKGVLIHDHYQERGQSCGPGLLVDAIRKDWPLPDRLRRRIEARRQAEAEAARTAAWQREHRRHQRDAEVAQHDVVVVMAEMPDAERQERADAAVAAMPPAVRRLVDSWCQARSRPRWENPLVALAMLDSAGVGAVA